MMLLPPPKDACPICAVKHTDDMPHNAQSMYYQYRFYGVRGRWPTWADAVAHCSEEVKAFWENALREKNAWTAPEGEPIADPPSESSHQEIGDAQSASFVAEDIN